MTKSNGMRRYQMWILALSVVAGLGWSWPGEAEACSKACICVPGRWVPNTAEVPVNAKGIYWVRDEETCHGKPYTPKEEDFKMMNISEDPPVEVPLKMTEPAEGVYLLAPVTPMELRKQYKVEFLADPCKDKAPTQTQEVKPLTFKAVDEGSFPTQQEIKLTQTKCNYAPDDMCDGTGVALSYKAELTPALKPWTDMWRAQLLVDGKAIASSTSYGTLAVSARVLCQKPEGESTQPVAGEFVVQIELSLPGTGHNYRSQQIRVAVKCEAQQTCVDKATAKAGDPPPPASGCGCQTQTTGLPTWPLLLLLLCFAIRSMQNAPYATAIDAYGHQNIKRD